MLDQQRRQRVRSLSPLSWSFVLINIGQAPHVPVLCQLERWVRNSAQVQPAPRLNGLDGAAQPSTRALLPPALCDTLALAARIPRRQLHTVFTGGGPIFPDLLRRLQAEARLDITSASTGSTEGRADLRNLSIRPRSTAPECCGNAAGQAFLLVPNRPVRRYSGAHRRRAKFKVARRAM